MTEIKDCDKNKSASEQQTIIIEEVENSPYELDVEYPYCKLPPYFFEHAKLRRASSRDVLSISTWDGRHIFSIAGKEENQ